jgi:hypothetical protein
MTTLENVVNSIVSDTDKPLSDRVHSIYWCTLEACVAHLKSIGKMGEEMYTGDTFDYGDFWDEVMAGRWD